MASCRTIIEGDLSMSKPILTALVVGFVTAAGVPAVSGSATAADLPVPVRQAAHWCGPCGCLHVSHVHHRELKSTYGAGFDPRSYDQTEPRYYFGPMHAYPRYWVAAAPAE
jgi:hypothetical protein